MSDTNTRGKAYLFTFPFWIYTDQKQKLELKLEEITYKGLKIRIYPPFRSAEANYTGMPYINPYNIPYPTNIKIRLNRNAEIFNLSVVPLLVNKEITKPAALPIFTKEWQSEIPEPFPMDSLRIDSLNLEEKSEHTIEKAINHFLSLIRTKTNQWWITHSTHVLMGYLRNEISIDEGGMPLDIPKGRCSIRAVSGFETGLNINIWNSCIIDLKNNVEVSYYKELFLDGIYYAAINAIRRSVLDLSSACEVAKELAIMKLWNKCNPDKNYKRTRVIKGYNLFDHLDTTLKGLSCSYKEEHPENYQKIKNMWVTRQNVAHYGKAEYTEDGAKTPVDDNILRSFILASKHCIEWLETISNV